MKAMSENIIVAIIGLLTGGMGAILTSLFQHRKTQAEADKDCADANEQIRVTVMALIEPLKRRIDELEDEVKKLQTENADLKDWAQALVIQIKNMGHEPIQFKSKKGKNA